MHRVRNLLGFVLPALTSSLGSYICLFKMRKQLEMRFPKHGGKRKNAGRKPNGEKAGVAHRSRAPLASRFPVHVTLRVDGAVGSLRRSRPYAALCRAIAGGNERGVARVVHYSVMGNHLHLLVEAKDAESLSRGVQGLSIRMARALNRALGRRGKVFADRFHARILKTPREVRNALAYVLENARKHGFLRSAKRIVVDPFSSGAAFDGWRKPTEAVQGPAAPVARARTWLLAAGWRRHGLLDPTAS
jgi:REP element-mobilizing transposase RayT